MLTPPNGKDRRGTRKGLKSQDGISKRGGADPLPEGISRNQSADESV
jgi:hypothetical protein